VLSSLQARKEDRRRMRERKRKLGLPNLLLGGEKDVFIFCRQRGQEEGSSQRKKRKALLCPSTCGRGEISSYITLPNGRRKVFGF